MLQPYAAGSARALLGDARFWLPRAGSSQSLEQPVWKYEQRSLADVPSPGNACNSLAPTRSPNNYAHHNYAHPRGWSTLPPSACSTEPAAKGLPLGDISDRAGHGRSVVFCRPVFRCHRGSFSGFGRRPGYLVDKLSFRPNPTGTVPVTPSIARLADLRVSQRRAHRAPKIITVNQSLPMAS